MVYVDLNIYMDAAAEIERNPVSTRFSLSMEMSRLTLDGTSEPVSRDKIITSERKQRNIHFPCLLIMNQIGDLTRFYPYSNYM